MMREHRHTVVALLLALVLAQPSVATARTTYREGSASRPFSVGALTGGRVVETAGDPRIVPRTAILWEFKTPSLDPRCIQLLTNGNVLIASRDGNRVLEVDISGRIVWTYTSGEYQAAFGLPATEPFLPFAVHRFPAPDGSQHTLVTLRKGAPVFELDENKNVVWSYGTGVSGTGPGQLFDAFSATRLAGGNTLIADNQGCRVIEVTPGGDIAWQYGVAGEPASAHAYALGYLDWPRTAQRIDPRPGDGLFTTLIADEPGQRVIEVDQSGAVIWQYGQNGVPGTGPGQLFDPSQAVELPDGTIMILDNPNKVGRVLHVARDHSIISVYPDPADTPTNGAMGETRSVVVSPPGASRFPGSVLMADESNDRVIRVGYESSVKLTSLDLDCGLPGVRKDFLAISWGGTLPKGTSLMLYYAVDDGAWQTAGSAKRIELPATAVGRRIKYRAVITTVDSSQQASIEAVSIEAAPAADHERSSATTGGTSSTGGTPTSAANGNTPTAPIPSGAKGSAGGALISDAGVEGVLDGPLETAAGHVLATSATSIPGLPGPGGAPGDLGGPAAVLGLTYLAGFAWYPARAGLARLAADRTMRSPGRT
ncbi:MAG: hypothetical protein D9V44_10750 [Actinobacteria bacterium]|nr:MAG: hypothetical protein D9V44_10750 [Actinomycetota bacterium]